MGYKINYKPILRYMLDNGYAYHSAIKDPIFVGLLKSLEMDTVVEIGTFRGASTALFACFARKVFTFDITDFPDKWTLWGKLELKEKIRFCTIKDREDIKNVLSTIKFDLGFVDAWHDYDNAKADWEVLKSCHRVILHDVNKAKFEGVARFAKEIGAVKYGTNVGYWEG